MRMAKQKATKATTKKAAVKKTVPTYAVRKQLREATLAIGRTKRKTVAKVAKKTVVDVDAAKQNGVALKLRKDGLSFRAMEEKMFGKAGSGTRAFNIFNRAVAADKASKKTKTTKTVAKKAAAVETQTAPNGARVIA